MNYKEEILSKTLHNHNNQGFSDKLSYEAKLRT